MSRADGSLLILFLYERIKILSYKSDSRLCLFYRQSNIKLCPLPGFRLHLDRPSMTFSHDIITQAQAQTRSLAGGFGSEEGLEDLLPDLLRYARAVVFN